MPSPHVRVAAGFIAAILVAACVNAEAPIFPCPEDFTACDGECVDTRFDPSHCGVCGNSCAEGQACGFGTCGGSVGNSTSGAGGGGAGECSGGTTSCDGGCVDAQNDRKHCGGCGVSCAEGEVCSQGVCALSCGGGTTQCGDACVDSSSNPKHCGACDIACGEGEVCAAGACQLHCGGGSTNCGTVCANVMQDPANCGTCGNACMGGPNAVGICAAAKCALACFPSYGNCNANDGDGCEIDTSVSTLHCGGCGKACPPVQNGTGNCAMAACGISACAGGFANCDNNVATGCETNLATNALHCGMCNKACPAGQKCQGAVCVQDVSYTGTFNGGQPATTMQCDEWNSFRAQLAGKMFSKVTLRGTNDLNGVSCVDANLASQICQGLGAGITFSVACGGRTWSVGTCGGGFEINANGAACQCYAGYTVRPCIGNLNWGGINQGACGAPSQTLEVVCSF